LNRSGLAGLLDAALGVEAVPRELAAGLLGQESSDEVESVWLASGGAADLTGEIAADAGAFVILPPGLREGAELSSRASCGVYAPGASARLRAPHLRAFLARAGCARPRAYLPSRLGGWLKLAVYVPESHLDEVAAAVADAGAGRFERYDMCSFRSRGVGSFRGGGNSKPFLGLPGQLEAVEEWRLEASLPERRLEEVEAALNRTHPYDEPAFDFYPLASAPLPCAAGLLAPLSEVDAAWLLRELSEAGGAAGAEESLTGAASLILMHESPANFLPEPNLEHAVCWVGGSAPPERPGFVFVGRRFEQLWRAHLKWTLEAAGLSAEWKGELPDAR
jgi:hypothetical protein